MQRVNRRDDAVSDSQRLTSHGYRRDVRSLTMAKALSSGVAVMLTLLTCAFPATAQDDHEHSRNLLPKKQHRDSDAPFLKPAEAVEKMAIPDGFEVSIFASEPDIAEPIAFCFDARGRMWVLENFNYRTRRNHTDDQVTRIQILEDTDGDGVFDRKKTFTDKLTFSSGIACGFGGVFVGSPPNLTFIPDADGDDRPDGPPEILLDGWGINDRHETLNSFIWGPDGWLYGCHGVFTQSSVGTPGAKDDNRQFIDGGIWRYHPERKKFEVFARGLSNPWGFDFDDHGQGFATCCVIPHLFHVVQGGVYHKQSKPHVNPYIYDDIKTIRDHSHLSAHGGARFYLADTFPEKYRNQLFMCNIHEHAVLTDYMVPKGSSFIGKHGGDFMPTNDLAWVGFSVEIGPEGGVYILDWHDQDVCGNAIKFPNSGRVYRIMPKGVKPIARPDLGAMSDMELVELQGHSNDWYVRQARTLLHSRAVAGKLDQAVHSKLEAMFETAPDAPERLRAMWALHVTGGLGADRLQELLSHDNEHVRSWAIQLLCDESSLNAFQPEGVDGMRSGPELDAATLQKFSVMAHEDASPVVRLYLASAAQRLPFDQRWPILDGLVSHAEDADDNNLPRMYWFALEPMVAGHPGKSLKLAVGGELAFLQESVARRIATGDAASQLAFQSSAKWNRSIARVAKGFRVINSGEGGVVHHGSFRNQVAVQTHPKNRDEPCTLERRTVAIPSGMTTMLKMRVSHHPHGDWRLRVLANKKVIADQIVGSRTVGDDEWLTVSVDLSQFAGKTINLTIENRANDWHCEWAYWNSVEIVSTPVAAAQSSKPAKIVFISGKPSHGPMAHEHRAGNMILADALNTSGLNVDAVVVPYYGYPKDKSVLADAATVVIFSTGHQGHVLKPHLDEFDAIMKEGTGVVMIHWATEAEKGKSGEKFLEWMGGFCDLDWSVNPHWKPVFEDLPEHPITNGVKPFSVHDEWYYHMRFVPEMKGVTPILTDLPPAETLRRPDGPRSGNFAVRKAIGNAERQHVAWAYERPAGGRGFGFTGAHNHKSWQNESFRKVVLNAILWTANVDVPEDGCASPAVTDERLKENVDDKGQRK